MRDWVSFVRDRLDLPPMKGQRDERMVGELADHLEELFGDAVLKGMTEAEAEQLVQEELAEAAAAFLRAEPARRRSEAARWSEKKETSLRSRGGFSSVLGDALRESRLTLRALARRPGFSVASVVVLSLGMGATVAMYALVDSIVLSPLSFPDQDRLVSISHAAPTRGMDDAGQCAAWHFTYEDGNRVFESMGMYSGETVTITGQGDPQAVTAMLVTQHVFRAVGLDPVLGRTFLSEDMDPNSAPTVMLSHEYWTSRFGSDPEVLGRSLRVDGVTREVVGVMPPEVADLGVQPSVLLPLRYDLTSVFVGNIGYASVARLRPGVELDAVGQDLRRLLPTAWDRFPPPWATSDDDIAAFSPVVVSLKDRLLGPASSFLWVLMGGVSVVLLMSCATVASLVLVRAEGRAGEMAVRVALGASRGRVRWEYAREAGLIVALSAVLAVALAALALQVLVAFAPEGLPRLDSVTLGFRAVAVVVGLAVGSTALFAVLPSLRSALGRPAGVLRTGVSRNSRGRKSALGLDMIAGAQVGLAVVLLIGSVLLLRSAESLRNVETGFSDDLPLLVFDLLIPSGEVEDIEETAQLHQEVLRRIELIPGVESVALASSIPLAGGGNVNPFHVEGRTSSATDDAAMRRHKWVGGGYFETLEIPVLAGRTFTWEDVEARATVAILSERLAKEYFGSAEAAIGGNVAARSEPVEWRQVVGVVADVREDDLSQPGPDLVYWPQVTRGFWEGTAGDHVQSWRDMAYAVRSPRVGTPGFADEVRAAVWEIVPTVPLTQVYTMEEVRAYSMGQVTFALSLLSLAAVLALVLGVVGVYGVIAYVASRQTTEFGLRLALGAEARDVRRLVLKRGLVIGGGGALVGVGAAVFLTPGLENLLFGVGSADPITFVLAPVVLGLAALVASSVPAIRASRTDPIEAIKAS